MCSINLKFYSFTNGAWYFDNIFNYYVTRPVINFGLFISYKLIDNQFLEYFGPEKLYSVTSSGAGKISNFHIGKLSIYVLAFIVFIFFVLLKF